jgi:hypothetical protein
MTTHDKVGSELAYVPAADQAECFSEWYAACTIEKCGAETRAFLAALGRNGFRKWAVKSNALHQLNDVLDQQQATDQMAVRDRPWVLFECYMCVPTKVGRKPYKDALIRAVTGGKTEIDRVRIARCYIDNAFRSVVRDRVRYDAGHLRSADGTIKQVLDSMNVELEGGTKLGDFLPMEVPDPSEEADAHLLREAAINIARELDGKIPDPMRVALVARQYGVSLADPVVAKRADRKSSQISEYLRYPSAGKNLTGASNLYAMIKIAIDEAFPDTTDPEPALRAYLQAMVISIVVANNKEWLARPENEDFFRYIQQKGELLS